jgi:hypothetical protein
MPFAGDLPNNNFAAYEAEMVMWKCKWQNVTEKPGTLIDTLSDEFIGVGTGWGAYKDALMKKTGVSHYTPDFYPKSQNLIETTKLQYKPINDNAIKGAMSQGMIFPLV